jgi:hypothetical protein
MLSILYTQFQRIKFIKKLTKLKAPKSLHMLVICTIYASLAAAEARVRVDLPVSISGAYA